MLSENEPGLASANTANIEKKLDVIIALLLRQLTPTQAEDWRDIQDKRPFVELLLDLGHDNNSIANILGMSYGRVANIKSERKRNVKKQK
jgi:hypothetical protein